MRDLLDRDFFFKFGIQILLLVLGAFVVQSMWNEVIALKIKAKPMTYWEGWCLFFMYEVLAKDNPFSGRFNINSKQ